MRIFGFIVALVTTIVVITNPELFNVPSLFVVVGGTIAGLMASFGTGVGSAFKAILTRNPSRETIYLGVAVCDRGRSLAVATGVVGTFIGLAIMLKHMDSPMAIGPGLSVSFLTLIYGMLLAYGILTPLVSSLKRRLEELES